MPFSEPTAVFSELINVQRLSVHVYKQIKVARIRGRNTCLDLPSCVQKYTCTFVISFDNLSANNFGGI